jgi:hypothetical protein
MELPHPFFLPRLVKTIGRNGMRIPSCGIIEVVS